MDFTPQRLTLARKRIGLTIAALAKATQISTRSISAYENGAAEPTAPTARLLAEKLQVSPEFFQLPEVDEIPLEAVSFRALSKMTARQRDAALSTGAQIVEFDTWLSGQFRFPTPSLPTLPGYEPALAAAAVRAKWGLGEQPIKNMVQLLEAHGVRVYSLRDDLKELDAFSFFADGKPFIMMSARKSGERSRFDAAHELGHLVLHCVHGHPRGPEAEAEANGFAAALLMPEAQVKAAGLRNATLPTVLRWRSHWGVAAMALTHRLRELGLVTEWGYRDLCIQLSKAGYRRGEPGGIPREKSERLRQSLALLRQSGVTTADIANELGVAPSETKSWMMGITMQAL